jgi:UDP:flavonoid glycosyltransferase YjiC (YdhE family)
MRILVAAMGSRGDVQPALCLALALRDAGHEVRVSAPPDFAAWAGELGLAFAPAGTSIEEVLNQYADRMGAGPLRLARAIGKVLLQHVPGMMERLLAAGEDADVIVSANQFLARTAAEVLGVPFAGVIYAPTLIRSSRHPPMIARWQGAPRWINRVLWSLTERGASRIFLEPINIERAKLGLAPVASFEAHVFGGVPYMLACDALVAPAPPDWTHVDVTTTGPWYYDDPAPLDEDVGAFLDAGPPPVYVGFGSMVSEDAAAATSAIVSGAGASRRRVLLSKGWAGLGAESLPDSIKVVRGPMPHAKLFPRVAAVVHHGGSGTTSAALRAGVPQVIVPHLMDQYYFAHRLEVLGIAPPAIPVRRLDSDRLARAIDAALALPPSARLEAAERLRPADGLQRAVALIEERVAPRGHRELSTIGAEPGVDALTR